MVNPQQHRGPRAMREEPREAARDATELVQRARAIAEAGGRADIVEQWKSQALGAIRPGPERDGAQRPWLGFRFNPLADWLRGLWRAHDAAHRIETSIAEGEALLQADDPIAAAHVAQLALGHALFAGYRSRLWLITAWAGIAQRDPFLTHAALQQLPAALLTLDLVAAYLSTCNRTAEATALLRAARRIGHRSRATSKQLIDLLVMRGATQEASRVAVEDSALLSSDDLSALAKAGLALSPRRPVP